MKRIIIVLALLLSACMPMRLALPTPTNIQVTTSIQTQCLDVVKLGEFCQIAPGIYNESLTLKTSGTLSSPITLRCESKDCTVNSGSAVTLQNGGKQSYYTFDGLRFISSMPEGQFAFSINLAKGWPSSYTATGGNTNMILRNCYVEGTVGFFGADNLVENCEFNGKSQQQNAITMRYAGSVGGVIQNNIIHDYTVRGVWVMGGASNTLVQNNTIYNSKTGINCDGASVPVYDCNVVNNVIYNIGVSGWGSGIFLEDAFGSLVEGNLVRDVKNGPSIFVQFYGAGSIEGWSTEGNIEYRDDPSNVVIKNNVLYNSTNSGIAVISTMKMTIDHNTFYNNGSPASIWFKTDRDDAGKEYPPKDETITNNIYKTILWDDPAINLVSYGNFTGDPLFVNAAGGDFHLQANSPACGAGAFPCGTVPPTATDAISTVFLSLTPSRTAVPPSFTPVPATKTPTATASKTPSSAPSRTITPSPTFTVTTTKTPTPLLAQLCLQSIWTRQLKVRPLPSMHNTTMGLSIDPGAIIPIESIIENGEGRWGKINWGAYTAIYLKSNSRTYSVLIACP